ncbi:M28 family metallopeptidase [Echinicola shivajiensis]|uniref:M28 family metallopeptidase n=1 Tax=Echinicola shivajiensis TaxID=1035916 RepID=UPI001FEC9F50|nr:M28 family metallopeptidase [Echinicola shivajiensis]
MKMKNLGSLFCLIVFVLFLACEPSSEENNAEADITAIALQKHISTLSSDEFRGRMPFTSGEVKTLDYLESEFKAMGLSPGNGESYFQDVPLVEITSMADSTMKLEGEGKSITFQGLRDYVISTQKQVDFIEVDQAEFVFAGFGIVAPEYNWNDYEGFDMQGKIAVVLVNDPGFGTDDESFFKGNTMTYYGRWTYKFEEAKRQGALGCLVVHNTIPAGYGFNVLQNSWNSPQLYLNPKEDSHQLDFEGWVSMPAASKLFEMAGYKSGELLAKARKPGFESFPLGIKASTGLKISVRHNDSKNVIAKLAGTAKPEEYVIYTAHWDHIGVGKPDAEGDSIFNGALDNASGTAALLEIAKAFAKGEKTNRSILFLAVTAEEQGLLGSAYYTEHPVYPISKTLANINIDGINPYGKMKDIVVVGEGQSDLEDLLQVAADNQGRYISSEPNPAAGYYFRSDHFNFAKVGVPALYTDTGIDLVGQGKEAGKALSDEYTVKYYHKQSDEYDSDRWNLEGAVEDAELLYQVGRMIDTQEVWPAWKEGSEFKSLR